MSYSAPNTREYNLGAITFTGSPAAQAIRVPKGARFAKVRDVHLMCSTTFGGTTTGSVDIGTAATAKKFVTFPTTTSLAATDARCFDDANGIVSGYELIDCTAEGIEQLEVTFTPTSGGTPAGVATVTVTIDWF